MATRRAVRNIQQRRQYLVCTIQGLSPGSTAPTTLPAKLAQRMDPVVTAVADNYTHAVTYQLQILITAVYNQLPRQAIKREKREADHSVSSSSEVKKEWIYTSTPPYDIM
jgi:hypothetical protein